MRIQAEEAARRRHAGQGNTGGCPIKKMVKPAARRETAGHIVGKYEVGGWVL